MQHIVVVGGGAAGLISAIYAKTKNTKVTILEKNQFCGKKILVTGNGKCNYWNSDQNIQHYHSTNEELLSEIITKELQVETLAFFNKLGIVPKIKNGYYYPFSNQASTIRNALLTEAINKNIEICTNFLVTNIIKEEDTFIIEGENSSIKADKVIIATGSKASPKTGSDGFGYSLLKKLGHTIIEPQPALVQLKTKGNYLKKWSGIRTDVELSLYQNGKLLRTEPGEIQLTDYGISGICVFNLSRYVAVGLAHKHKEEIVINFLPFIKQSPLISLAQLFNNNNGIKTQLEGVLNNKLVDVILEKTNLSSLKSFHALSEKEKNILINALTAFKVEVTGTNSFEQAQVCVGGVPLTEIIIETMESRLIKGLYIIGELLDVDGDCGGYNLGFAWMSGILAGKGSGLDA